MRPNKMTEKFSAKIFLKRTVAVTLLICLVFFHVPVFSETVPGKTQETAVPGSFSVEIASAEKDISSSNFKKARKTLENVLKEDNANENARKLLAQLSDYQEKSG
ncbi:MAG TPA: hypothetical protein PKZ41_00430, partial [Candidatus Omnitrophota bacterium]|nr:hypothetical protein [Candidatus Omnitrophota bacterium]